MLTPREKSPPPKKFSSEEDGTHDAASSRTASPTHYHRALPAPGWCLTASITTVEGGGGGGGKGGGGGGSFDRCQNSGIVHVDFERFPVCRHFLFVCYGVLRPFLFLNVFIYLLIYLFVCLFIYLLRVLSI